MSETGEVLDTVKPGAAPPQGGAGKIAAVVEPPVRLSLPEDDDAASVVEAAGHFRIYLGAAAGVGKGTLFRANRRGASSASEWRKMLTGSVNDSRSKSNSSLSPVPPVSRTVSPLETGNSPTAWPSWIAASCANR